MGLFDYPGTPKQGADHASTPAPLSEITILEDLTPDDWERVLKLVETRQFQTGEDLARIGERDSAIFILTDGEVEVRVDGPDGPNVMAVISQGSVFGEIAFFDGEPRSATIRARSAGSAVRVTRKNFETLAAWEPTIARQLLFDLGRVLAIRLRRTTSLMIG